MTYIPSPSKDFAAYTAVETAPAVVAPRRGLWMRIFDAIWYARQRQADAEIARYLAMNGGKLTDSMEREMADRLRSDNFRLR